MVWLPARSIASALTLWVPSGSELAGTVNW